MGIGIQRDVGILCAEVAVQQIIRVAGSGESDTAVNGDVVARRGVRDVRTTQAALGGEEIGIGHPNRAVVAAHGQGVGEQIDTK